jgi:hypothetical protein
MDRLCARPSGDSRKEKSVENRIFVPERHPQSHGAMATLAKIPGK